MKIAHLTVLTILLLTLSSTGWAATAVPFTVNTSEAVTVTTTGGTPRLQLDVGGVTRYASYVSGSGTAALTFTYTTQAGDLDLDGLTVASPLQLNGGVIADAAGNALSPLTFTVPTTSGIRVDHPSLSMDFTNGTTGRYTINGTAYTSLASFLTAAGGTFTRASVGTYFDNAGVMQTAASGAARFDHDPVTHAAKGLLIEEARTNSLVYSTDIKNARWIGYCGAWVNGSSGVADPAGGMNAIRIPANSNGCGAAYASGILQCTEGTCTTGAFPTGTYTLSFWGRTESGTMPIGFSMGDSQPGTICTLTTTWQRCVGTVTKTHTGDQNDYRILQIAEAIQTNPAYQLFAPQVEAGDSVTSYIPTAGSTMTRAADNLSMPVGSWYNAAGSSIFTDTTSSGMGTVSYPGLFNLGQSAAERLGACYGPTGALVAAEQRAGGVQSVAIQNGAFTGVHLKTAASFAPAGVHLRVNGGAVNASTAGNFPATVTSLQIGRLDSWLNGHMAKFQYYPARVPDAQLQLQTQ